MESMQKQSTVAYSKWSFYRPIQLQNHEHTHCCELMSRAAVFARNNPNQLLSANASP